MGDRVILRGGKQIAVMSISVVDPLDILLDKGLSYFFRGICPVCQLTIFDPLANGLWHIIALYGVYDGGLRTRWGN